MAKRKTDSTSEYSFIDRDPAFASHLSQQDATLGPGIGLLRGRPRTLVGQSMEPRGHGFTNPMTMQFLLIEDDPVDAEALRRLIPADVVLSQATTLQNAIREIQEREYHLILLDLGLPDSRGIETFLQLRDVADSVPIVVLTGFDSEQLAVRAIKEGAQDYLVKGYLDRRSLRSLGFAVERDKLIKELENEKRDRGSLEEKLRQQERQLAHMGRVTLMGRVVAEIVHEVGQPLQAIANIVAAIDVQARKGGITNERLTDHLGFVDEGIEQTQGILNRLRSFIKDSDPDQVPVDLNELIRTTLDFVDAERRKLKIDIVQELCDEQTKVLADRVQIQQILVNLIGNAFDAIGDLEPCRRSVVVRTSRNDGRIKVEIQDSGTGLEIDSEQLFMPFVTTKENGLGMGLAICSRIAKNHGGTIAGHSANGATLFCLDLPEQS